MAPGGASRRKPSKDAASASPKPTNQNRQSSKEGINEDDMLTPRSEKPPEGLRLNFSPAWTRDSRGSEASSSSRFRDGSTADGGYFAPAQSSWEEPHSPRSMAPPPRAGFSDGDQTSDPSMDSVNRSIDAHAQTGNRRATDSQSTLPSEILRISNPRHPNDPIRYPDQTLSALQSPTNAPPRPSRMPRTRSTHSSSLIYTISSQESSPTAKTHPHHGARTVGSTPVQSPGLYSPSFPRKYTPVDSEDGRPSSQILHATNMPPPKETHELNKDFDPVSGRKVLNNFELMVKLGSGQHGTVKLGRDNIKNRYVAVKIVRRHTKKARLGRSARDPDDTIKREIAILKQARHPHVVSLYEVIDDDSFEKVYLILEYVERGEIVWRKPTDRAIARFEIARLERERRSALDLQEEDRMVEEFNTGVVSRRSEREQVMTDRTREALDRLGPEFSAPVRQPSMSLWSLEYGGESEHEEGSAATQNERVEQVSQTDSRSWDSGTPSMENIPTEVRRHYSRHTDYRSGHSQTSSRLPSTAPSLTSSPHHSRPPSRQGTRPQTPAPIDRVLQEVEEDSPAGSQDRLNRMLERINVEHGEDWTLEEEEYRYVPCLTLHQALEAFRDTVLGLEYLHYQGIIHRDIKPANLLWTQDYRVKISDFGVSYLGKPIRENSDIERNAEGVAKETLELAKTVGTPAFYAPELCDPKYFDFGPGRSPARPGITGQIDVWALGVTLYGMIYGRLPFFDANEFRMYDKIARDEVFVSSRRLRGVQHTNKMPTGSDKRLDDVVDYQDVDETLQDLIKKLLRKDPAQRITLKEVKHHPWVLSGIEDKEAWLDETDPARHSEGRKIEVSSQDMQDAFGTGTLFEKVKAKVTQGIGSVFRGRSTRKRAGSTSKGRHAGSPDASSTDGRGNLHGDEQILSALKTSREAGEHPLAQSLAASPNIKSSGPWFGDDDRRPRSAFEPWRDVDQPLSSSRAILTDDSMKTVRASDNFHRLGIGAYQQESPAVDELAETTSTVVDTSNPGGASSITGMIGIASRRLVSSMRSREQLPSRPSLRTSSRSSSTEHSLHSLSLSRKASSEDYHASPSLGISSLSAAGHVDLPPALRESEMSSFHQESNRRHAQSIDLSRRQSLAHPSRRQHQQQQQQFPDRRLSLASHSNYDRDSSFAHADSQLSMDHHQHQIRSPLSGTDSQFAPSSSSDQMGSPFTSHSQLPSVISGASSLSATAEATEYVDSQKMGHWRPGRYSRRASNRSQLVAVDDDDEAGYHGEGESGSESDRGEDEDDDDEPLAMRPAQRPT